jgi:hypothetical protein
MRQFRRITPKEFKIPDKSSSLEYQFFAQIHFKIFSSVLPDPTQMTTTNERRMNPRRVLESFLATPTVFLSTTEDLGESGMGEKLSSDDHQHLWGCQKR